SLRKFLITYMWDSAHTPSRMPSGAGLPDQNRKIRPNIVKNKQAPYSLDLTPCDFFSVEPGGSSCGFRSRSNDKNGTTLPELQQSICQESAAVPLGDDEEPRCFHRTSLVASRETLTRGFSNGFSMTGIARKQKALKSATYIAEQTRSL
ncbi:hypothetical protein AVEN_275150-1, partial [Araneus ventricosus]